MLGVSVSVAGIVALISVSEGMRTSLDSYLADSGADLLVFSRDAADLAFSKIHQDEIDAMKVMPGVETASRANFMAVLNPKLGDDHEKIPFLLCFGRFWNERLADRYVPMLQDGGRMPTTRSEILVGTTIADSVKLKVGDRVPLFSRKHFGIESYEVVGIYQSAINWENGGIVASAEVVKEETGKKDTYNLVFIYTEDSERESIRKAINEKFEHLVALPPAQFTERFSGQLEFLDQFVVLITIIAMIVGILGVLNTMMMSVAERTREIGMLRALGWSRRLIVKTIVIEGLLLSVVGGLFGLFLGYAGTELLILFFPGGFLEAAYLPSTFAKGFAVALAVGVVAAVYPAVRAANLRPVEALRYE